MKEISHKVLHHINGVCLFSHSGMIVGRAMKSKHPNSGYKLGMITSARLGASNQGTCAYEPSAIPLDHY